MKQAAFWSMIVLRAVFLGLVLFIVMRGEWNAAAMHVPIFLITLPLAWFGRKDEQFYWLDAAIMMIFVLALLNTLLFSWPDYHTPYSYDKIFHAAGGAWAAAFAAVLLRTQIKSRPAFYLCIIAIAVSIGAFWEVFEWVLALLPQPFYVENTGLADAMMDIIADTIGAAVVAAVLALRRYI